MKPTLQLSVCPNFAGEFRAALAALGCADVELCVCATTCHAAPAATAANPGGATPRRWVLCSPPRGRAARPGDELMPVEQCFHLVAGKPLVTELQRGGAYLLTPGWVRHWLELMARWGFDQAGARAFFGEAMREVVLLDTGVDPEAGARSAQFAAYVGLPLRQLAIGLEPLTEQLGTLLERWRTRLELERVEAALARSQRVAAELAMALELLRHLSGAPTEVEAAARVCDVFQTLFAPRAVAVLLMRQGSPRDLVPDTALAEVRACLQAFQGTSAPWGDDGFLLRLQTRGETVATMQVTGLAFPDRRDDALEMARSMAEQCATAIVSARQVMEQRAVELELRHAQRLESVGRLASGIAHEINTPVQFIGDNLSFLRDGIEASDRVLAAAQALREKVAQGTATAADAQALAALEEETDQAFLRENLPQAIAQMQGGLGRIATIVRSMREFAHPGGPEMVLCDLEQTLRTTLEVARAEYKHVADVETHFAGLPPVLAYPAELHQVFLNLVVNAAQAMEDKVRQTHQKGRLTVRTAMEGDQVVVSIGDTGTGIPEAAREHVFDQFFTTKEVGKGTGQGLAIAWRVVVDRHGGTLTFETKAGEGTTFFVRLPARTDRA